MEDDGLPVLPGFREIAQRRRRVIDELAGARRAAGLSQTEVAARMGTSQSVMARLESGEIDARLSTLQRYAAGVGGGLGLGAPPPRPAAAAGRAPPPRSGLVARPAAARAAAGADRRVRRPASGRPGRPALAPPCRA